MNDQSLGCHVKSMIFIVFNACFRWKVKVFKITVLQGMEFSEGEGPEQGMS